MKLKDLEGFPKNLLKKKSLPIYKAFIITDPEEYMDVKVDIDLLAITEEAAVRALINDLPLDEIQDVKGKTISFAIITIEKESLDTKDVVDHGDIYFKDEILSITLKDKIYQIDVYDKILEDVTIDIDENTEIKLVSNIKLVDA